MSALPPLRIFVAIPGKMPENKEIYVYQNSQQVKDNLLEPVRNKLKKRLKRHVDLIIEKDKKNAGPIHESMFKEAYDADVYIAELSGANPNVYLELGVRWAWRDKVTVLITQNNQDIKFNVQGARYIEYKASEINKAIDLIVEAIEEGLNNHQQDSPVLSGGRLTTVLTSELDNLKSENIKLNEILGESLIKVAMTKEKDERILFLKQALDKNPASAKAMLELARTYRGKSMYDEAANYLKKATELEPLNHEFHRELGVTYSKDKKVDLAIESLRKAARLDPADKEALNNLGGALRRMGMAKAPEFYDHKALEEALDSYNKAHKIDRFDLYSGLNVARLNLLLSKWDPGLFEVAKDIFRSKFHLCCYEVDEDPDNYWLLFDLADTLLFLDKNEESLVKFNEAVKLIPPDERKDKLNTVLGPFHDYLTAGVLKDSLNFQVEDIIKKFSNN